MNSLEKYIKTGIRYEDSYFEKFRKECPNSENCFFSSCKECPKTRKI